MKRTTIPKKISFIRFDNNKKRCVTDVLNNVPTSGFSLLMDDTIEPKLGSSITINYKTYNFSISKANLIFILNNSNKLEDTEFVFGITPKNKFVLIPYPSEQYDEIKDIDCIINNNLYLKSEDMEKYSTYLTNKSKKAIYLGFYNYYSLNKKEKIKKVHYFYDLESKKFFEKNRLGRFIIKKVTDIKNCNHEYIIKKFQRYEPYNPYDESKDEFTYYTVDEFREKINATIERELEYNNMFPEERERKITIINNYSAEEEREKLYSQVVVEFWSADKKIIREFDSSIFETGQSNSISRVDYNPSNDTFELYSDSVKFEYGKYYECRKGYEITFDEFFDKYKPCKKKRYLLNGEEI